MHLKLFALLTAASTVAAQALSFCDKYTTVLFTDNTAANQYKLLVAVVNTAVIGNYSETKNGAVVPGILAPGQVGGVSVDLLPYFNGVLTSTNQGGSSSVSVNFLDDGGASALKAGRPSNGKSSRQYLLLTHLYEYFGTLLGCSMQGGSDFPAYAAHSSQYNVHKFMVLSPSEVTYFIEQVAASALSFGVTPEDIAPVGQVLMNLFGFRCSPPTTVVPSQGAQLQSICSAQVCPIAANSTCVGVQNITHPAVAIPGVVPIVPGTNTTYPNGTYYGKPRYCNPARCRCGCKGAICPCGYTDCNGPQCDGDYGSEGSGNGGSGGQGGAGGIGGSGSGTGTGSGAGSGSGSGSGGSGSGTGSGSGSTGAGSGSGSGAGGNGGYTPTTVSTAGAAALGMSFIAVVGGAIAFFLL
ncbi:hypothetical protein BKA65DRAFT_575796 [Rhexocercosporidium sp. MPI-PUGE-AT-0058]|nr:hypothetical protein BKA65DRAFT_575796 [Rhexocercosporidium sp. MPI-PUGE-AT-0058]